ncbi:MAG: hypothetical protein SGILL_000950 [Bacillariaceae sp.]
MPKWGWGASWLKNDNSSSKDQESAETSETATTSSNQPFHSTPQHPPSPKSQSPQKKQGAKKTKGKKKKGAKVAGNKAKKSKLKAIEQSDNSPCPPLSTQPSLSDLETKERVEFEQRRETVHQETVWYEDELRERQASSQILCEADERALELFRRLSAENLKDSSSMAPPPPLDSNELDELISLSEERKRVQREEAELEILLERLDMGGEIDQDRLHYLELRSRQRLGENLNEEEDVLLYHMELDRQDEEDLADIVFRQDNGEEIDNDRLYELNLLSRKRNGDETMTDDEYRDVELLLHRREDARADQVEYLELLQLKEAGEVIDEERLYILSVVDRQLRNDDLTEEEANDVSEYFEIRDGEHLDAIELSMLLESKESGLPVDEERIYELDLLQRKRHGEDLTEAEEEDLAVLFERRERIIQQVQELNELVLQKENGEDIDEDRLYELELLERHRQGQELSAEEEEDLHVLDERRRKTEREAEELRLQQVDAEIKEFEGLLIRKERGQEIDETRLYELQLYEKERQGSELTEDELMDLELFDMQRMEERNDGDGKDGSADESNQYDDDSLSSHDDMKSTLQEKEDLQVHNIREQLEKQGLPVSISWSSPLSKSTKLDMSFVSHGENSYIQDLLNQNEQREGERHEECLEEALVLYQNAAKDKDSPENEQLFLSILAELQEEKKEEWKSQDIEFKALLEREIENSKARKNAMAGAMEHDAVSHTKELAHAEAEQYKVDTSNCLALGMPPNLTNEQESGDQVVSHIKLSAKKEELTQQDDVGAIETCTNGTGLGKEAKNNSATLGEQPLAEEAARLAEVKAARLAEAEEAARLAKAEEARLREQANAEAEAARLAEAEEDKAVASTVDGPDAYAPPDTLLRNSIDIVENEITARGVYDSVSAKLVEKKALLQEKAARREAVELSMIRLEQDRDPPMSFERQQVWQSGMVTDQNLADISTETQQEPKEQELIRAIALTDGEINELNHLLDAQEQGLVVDEERLYELEILDRFSLGDDLSPKELDDLNVILKRRERFQNYTKEYNILLDKQESGHEVDLDRLHLLELVVRQRLGEELSADELEELHNFQAIEVEMEAAVDDVSHLSLTSGTLLSGQPLTLLEEVDEEAISESDPEMSASEHQDQSLSNGSSLLDSRLDKSKSRTNDQACELPRHQEEVPHADEAVSSFIPGPIFDYQGDDKNSVADAATGTTRAVLAESQPGAGADHEVSGDIGSSNGLSEDGDKSEDLPSDIEASMQQNESLVSNGPMSKLEKTEPVSADNTKTCDFTSEAKINNNSTMVTAEPSPTTMHLVHPGQNPDAAGIQQHTFSLELSDTKDCSDFYTGHGNVSGGIKSTQSKEIQNVEVEGTHNLLREEEQKELEELVLVKEAGGDLDEDRMYELDLLDRFSHEESLTSLELEDLDFILERRKRQDAYKQEFETLDAHQKEGKPIDTERFYFLGLLERHRLGLVLTDEEIAEIEDFEADEDAWVEDDDQDVQQELDHGSFQSTELQSPTNDVVAQARVRAMALLNSSDCSLEHSNQGHQDDTDVNQVSDEAGKTQSQPPMVQSEAPRPYSTEANDSAKFLVAQEDFDPQSNPHQDESHSDSASHASAKGSEPDIKTMPPSPCLPTETLEPAETAGEHFFGVSTDVEVSNLDHSGQYDFAGQIAEPLVSDTLIHLKQDSGVLGPVQQETRASEQCELKDPQLQFDMVAKTQPEISQRVPTNQFRGNGLVEAVEGTESMEAEGACEESTEIVQTVNSTEDSPSKLDIQGHMEQDMAACDIREDDESGQNMEPYSGANETPGAVVDVDPDQELELDSQETDENLDDTSDQHDEVTRVGVQGQSFCNADALGYQSDQDFKLDSSKQPFVGSDTCNGSMTTDDKTGLEPGHDTEPGLSHQIDLNADEAIGDLPEYSPDEHAKHQGLAIDFVYGSQLLERVDNGEELTEDKQFELDMFLKQQEGTVLSPDEMDELAILAKRRAEEAQDSKELETLRLRASEGESIDEDRYYELELFQLSRDGAELTSDELFELGAFDRLRSGEQLSAEEQQDLDILREERLCARLDREELEQLHEEKIAGSRVDEQRLFELKIKEKARCGEELLDEEVYALELFNKMELGEFLTDVERCDLDILSGQPDPADGQNAEAVCEPDHVPKDELRSSVLDDQSGAFDSNAEARNGDEDAGSTASQATSLSLSQPFDLETLRQRRENGLDYDQDLLYELELFELRDQGATLNKDELFEVQMFEKRVDDTPLTAQEIDSLKMLQQRRIDARLDEEELFALREQRERGEEVDEDLLHELELFEKMRAGNFLTGDEEFEIELFQLIRDGEVLTEEQIQELELLKTERIEATLDERDLQILCQLKLRGEPVDEELLYELELFHRKRNGETLSEDEAIEFSFFQRQRDGEDLLEDDLDELEMLRARRLGQGGAIENVTPSSADTPEGDDESVYRRELLDRQMKGQRLDKQEFVWLEILKKKKREEILLEDELDELDVMRRHKKETIVEVEVKQTRKLLEREMEKKMKRELRLQKKKENEARRLLRRIEKEEKKEQRRKEKQHKQMLKERRAKVKKMRRKKRKEGTSIDNNDSIAAASTQPVEEQKPASNSATSVEIVDMPPTLQPPKEEAKRGLFGGVFGARNSKKEQELEEARRKQEELIKEQMKAMALETELIELEAEKELQKELVKETVDQKSSGSAGSFSWETDSGVDSLESDGEESSAVCSSEESDSDSESSSSSILSVDSFSSASKTTDDKDDVSFVGRRVSEERRRRADERREMNLRLRESIQRRQGNHSGLDATALKASLVTAKSTDDVSVASAESRTEEQTRATEGAFGNDKDRPSKNKSKIISLSSHLRKKNKKRSSRKNKARYGDDISLGTLQLSKVLGASGNDKAKTDAVPTEPKSVDETTREKTGRPWMSEADAVLQEGFAPDIPRPVDVKTPPPAEVEKFFNSENQHVFERSVFNFNQSFGSKLSLVQEDDRSNSNMSMSESESVASGILVKEEEINPSIENGNDIEDEMSLVESLTSSFVSLTEEKFIFETPDYEKIESRLAEKLRHKEAEFDAAWENIVADENVAAQINQRLKERQRTKGTNKKEQKEEPVGLYDVPRLFLFEGEKVDTKRSKKKKRKWKRKDRRMQKKLDRTLSKEFRKAMREVFNSDSEEEYDRTFGEDNERLTSTNRPSNQGLLRDGSDPSMNDSGSLESEESDELDHGAYMARLKDRSMQQKVRKDLYESRRQLNVASTHSEMSSDDDEFSQNSELSHRELSRDESTGDTAIHQKGRRVKKNRNGELIGEHIDPADVYSKELEKQKVKKAFTIADLRKEMEDLKQANFDPASMETTVDTKKPKAPKLKKPKSTVNMAGPGSLTPQRPGLGNKMQSFTTAAKELGLLSGGKTNAFGAQPETIQEYEDEEDAFLTGGRETSGDFGDEDDGGFNDSKASAGFGFKGAGLSNFSFFGASGFTKTPSKAKKKPAHGSSFGGFGGGGFSGDNLPGPPVVSPGGFQEPLPLPEMQEEDHQSNRRPSMFGNMGKSSKRFMSKFKLPLKRTASSNQGGGGFIMDDDDDDQFEGGMGLLG